MAQTDRDSATTTPPSPPPNLQEAVEEAQAAALAAQVAQAAAEAAAEDAAGLVRGTPITTNGAGAYDFAVPAGIKWFMLVFDEVNLSVSDSVSARAIVGGSAVTTGYESDTGAIASGGSSVVRVTDCFKLGDAGNSLLNFKARGTAIFINLKDNDWVCVSEVTSSASALGILGVYTQTGRITLAGDMQSVRVTPRGGSGTFIGGTITPFWM